MSDALSYNDWFGLRPPAGASVAAAYGCRAILRHNMVDVVWDRQQATPKPLPKEFNDWVSTHLSLWLTKRCGESWIDPAGTKTFVLDDGKFHAIACPNGSHGYLYVGAWMERGE